MSGKSALVDVSQGSASEKRPWSNDLPAIPERRLCTFTDVVLDLNTNLFREFFIIASIITRECFRVKLKFNRTIFHTLYTAKLS
jgi:hypothetical protein